MRIYSRPFRLPGRSSWFVHVTDDDLPWGERTNARRRISTGQLTRHAAEQWVREHTGQLTSQSTTFGEAFKAWLRAKLDGTAGKTKKGRSKRITSHTYDDYLACLNTIYLPHFGANTSVAAVRKEDVDRLLAKLRDKERTPRTLNRHLMTIKQFFDYCSHKDRRFCKGNPCEDIAYETEVKHDPRALTPEEEDRLLCACRDAYEVKNHGGVEERLPPAYLAVAVLFALRTAFRKANILGLRWSQLDLARGRVFLPGETTKSKRDQAIPLEHGLLEELKRYREHHAGGPEDFVFPARDIKRAWKAALARAGIRNFRFHQLKTTCLSRLAPFTDLKTLQKIGQHKKIETTMKYYVATTEARVQEALDKAFTKAAL